MSKERRAYRRIYWPRHPRDLACIFTVYLRNVGSKSKPIPVDFVEETTDPDRWARDHCAYFNRMRLAGEPEREVVFVVRRGRCAPQKHKWVSTNLPATRVDGILVDSFICARCGITGKRSGWLHWAEPRRDDKYHNQEFARCDTAKAIMNSRRKGYGSLAKKAPKGSKPQKASTLRVVEAKRK